MSKYAPLKEHLLRQQTSTLRMSFAEIERVVGAKLPRSATTHRAWWSNNGSNNVMTKAWLEAGFVSEQVDLERRTLSFRRSTSDETGEPTGSGEAAPSPKKPAMYGWMRGTVRIAPGVDLTEPADPDWGKSTE